MHYIHDAALDLSIQQTEQGRLPSGILQELENAKTSAHDFLADLGPEALLLIDRMAFLEASSWPKEVVLKATAQGFYSRWLPKALGGGGWHPLSMYGFNLEVGAECLGVANLIGAHYVGMGLVSAANAFDVLRRIIQDIRAAEKNGHHCVVSAAITEPAAGSDLEDVELIRKAKVVSHACKVKGGYILNGRKIFISNATFASWHIVSAFEDLHNPAGSAVLLAVPASSPGVSLGRAERKMGQSASPASVLFFDDVFVADENICLARSQFEDTAAFLKASEFLVGDVLSLSRAGVACMATGVLKRSLEILLQNIKERAELESQDWSQSQWIQAQVGMLTQHLLTAKALSWEGHVQCYSRGPYKDLQKPFVYLLLKRTPSWLLQKTLGLWLASPSGIRKMRQTRSTSVSLSNEKIIGAWSSLLKSSCADLAVEGALEVMSVVGAQGGPLFDQLEKILRDAKLLQIYEGTSEFNRLLIYKNMVGPAEHALEIFKELS
jgi:butyryl-CoA dehydrogenase